MLYIYYELNARVNGLAKAHETSMTHAIRCSSASRPIWVSDKNTGSLDNIKSPVITLAEFLPDKLIRNCMLFVMKEDIQPIWEDKRNLKGRMRLRKDTQHGEEKVDFIDVFINCK